MAVDPLSPIPPTTLKQIVHFSQHPYSVGSKNPHLVRAAP